MAEPAFIDQPSEQKAAQADRDSTPAHGPGSSTPSASDGEDTVGTAAPQEDADHELRTELKQLRRAMQTRPPIDKAMGVLMAAHRLTEDEAWNVLVTASQHTNTKLYLVAGKIVASIQADAVDVWLRQTIEAALKELRTR